MKMTKTFLTCDKYFPDDKESRNIYRVTISNRGKRISFKFGDSIADTREGKEIDDIVNDELKQSLFTSSGLVIGYK